MDKVKKYNIQAKFTTTIDFPIIEAKNKKEAIEKAEFILLTDKYIEESQGNLIDWKIDKL